MSISKSALDKISGAATAVDSFKATLDAFVEDQTITPQVAGVVALALSNNAAVLEPAILSGVNAKAAKVETPEPEHNE